MGFTVDGVKVVFLLGVHFRVFSHIVGRKIGKREIDDSLSARSITAAYAKAVDIIVALDFPQKPADLTIVAPVSSSTSTSASKYHTSRLGKIAQQEDSSIMVAYSNFDSKHPLKHAAAIMAFPTCKIIRFMGFLTNLLWLFVIGAPNASGLTQSLCSSDNTGSSFSIGEELVINS